MRFFILLVFFGTALNGLSKWTPYPPDFRIISDGFSSSVPPGYFVIEGHVREQSLETPLKGVAVTNGAGVPVFLTDSAGFYRGIFPVSDTAIFCFKRDFTNEVILKYDFKNRHSMIVDFYLMEIEPSSEGTTIIVQPYVYKPVLYAYNAPSNVSLQLNPAGEFTFTYPRINIENQWNITTNPDGSITELSSGKNYPYLFWEGKGKNLDFIVNDNCIEGYLIKTDSCITFLENVLTRFGLTSRESVDFITFWAPKMIQKNYALIQFLPTETYAEKIAELNISPMPDALLRLYMYIMPLDEPLPEFQIISPEIKPFDRTGFTIVEWGGSVFDKSRVLN